MNIVTTIALILFAAAQLVFCILLLFAGLKLRRIYRETKETVFGFISPAADNEPSPLAKVGSVFADMIGRAISASLKSTFMGKASGESRSESATQVSMLEEALPGIGGKLGRSLKRNPGLLDLAIRFLGDRMAGNPRASGNGGESSSPRFRL